MTELRELSKKYAQEKMRRTEYRRMRREYILRILSGKAQPTENQYPALMLGNVQSAGTASSTSSYSRLGLVGVNGWKRFPFKKILPYAIGCGFLAVIAVAVLVFSGDDGMGEAGVPQIPSNASSANPDEGSAEAPKTPLALSETALLMVAFLEKNDWRSDVLNEFIAAWNLASDEEKQVILNDPLAQKFKLALQKQVQDQKALVGIGKREEAIKRQRLLLDFAKQIGVYSPDFEKSLIQ